MKDPATMIKDLLVTNGFGPFGASSDFGIFIGQPPDSPDALILLNNTGGMSPEPHLLLNYPSLQVMVRGARSGYAAAADKIQEVVNCLLGITTNDLSGDIYTACNQIGDVTYLGQDDNTRPLFSANFRFIVLPQAMANGHRVAI